ncbi:MAG: hypothetical protein KC620_13540 [Myxococcales bacterium]|nr:hypothetical protein [Myxococcales bacterium]
MQRGAPLLATLLLAACSVERGAGPFPDRDGWPSDAVATSDAGLIDGGVAPLTRPEGTWMLFTEDRKCLYAAGDPVENLIWSWYVVDVVRPDAGSALLRQSVRLCHQELSPLSFGFITLVPDIIPDNLDPVTVAAFLVGPDPGEAYVSDEMVSYWGVTGIGPDEPLPTSVDDPRVFDLEDDGHPGVTLPVTTTSGMELCQVYAVQRIRQRLRGVVVNNQRVDGTFSATTDKEVIDATTALCASGALINSQAESHFSMVRIDGLDGSPDLDDNRDGEVDCDEFRDAIVATMQAYGLARSAPESVENCPQ